MNEAEQCGNWAGVLQALTRSEIEFYVVGGAALALHGLPRTTLDVDVCVPADAATLQVLFHALPTELRLLCRQPSMDAIPAELVVGQWVSFGLADGPDLLDVYLESPAQFRAHLGECELVDVGDASCPVLSLTGIKVMKRRVARPIDLADIALIEELERVSAATTMETS